MGETTQILDERRELVQRVLASRTFAKSARLARFLEFICLRTLDGNTKEINEQQIGIHVFARSPHYVASEDSIVRTQARLLRLKLDEYFENEAPHAPMTIAIPKGGYIPVFEPRHTVSVVEIPAARPLPVAEPETPPAAEQPFAGQGQKLKRPWHLIAAAACVALLLLGFWGVHLWSRARVDGPSHALWLSIFAPGQRAILVPSDDALVLFQELIQAPVPLETYLNGSYLEQLTPQHIGTTTLSADWFINHQYTSTADLNLAMRLGRLPEALNSDVETRNARVLRLDDLKSSNVVLIGGIGANPWVSVFTGHLNFDVNWDWKTSEGYVLNKHPQHGEASIYKESVSDGFRQSYGVLAYLPGLGDSGNALLFEGTGMAGTESAADFPFNERSFADFARQIGAGSGPLPHFEALLETTSVGGNAPEARLVAWRIVRP